MNSIIINKRLYDNKDSYFNKINIQGFENLKVYREVANLERLVGIVADFAESYSFKSLNVNVALLTKSNTVCSFFLNELEHVSNISSIKTKNFDTFDNEAVFMINVDSVEIRKKMNIHILVSKEFSYYNSLFKTKIPMYGTEYYLYLSSFAFDIFKKDFWYYFDNGQFKYDNLICYCMIVKNAGEILEKVLIENMPIIDRWVILDTGSTDGTQDVIRRVLKNKKGCLYEEPFINFRDSRNRCLDLAKNYCKYKIMLDDTYSVQGNLRHFLNITRGDQFSDSYSIMLKSEDTEYFSNRIIKSKSNLKYIHKVHEVITDENNNNVTVPPEYATVMDYRTDYMNERTNTRKLQDLETLVEEYYEDQSDPRNLYYIAQTYACLNDIENKAKYFEMRMNHPTEGFIQEKIDAIFELARTYNFELNKDWSIIEPLYLKAWELDKKRPDSLYFLGIHYFLEKDYPTAYRYLREGFEVGYPVHCQYSLKPTLSFCFLPRFLTETCYYLKDYQLGEKSALLYLQSSKYNKPGSDAWDLVVNWYQIHQQYNFMGTVNTEVEEPEQKIITFVTDGGWAPWRGSDILVKGMGGSETWIIEVSKYVKQLTNYRVIVFTNLSEPETFEGVEYLSIKEYPSFIANNIVEYSIISRYPQYVGISADSNCKNVGLIFHDLIINDTIIPTNPKIKDIFLLTDWHKNEFNEIFPCFGSITKTLAYGINEPNEEEYIPIKNSFIYSSFPNRGLLVLLQMWPRIKEILPDATLSIFCDLENNYVNTVAPDQMNEIKRLIPLLEGVTNYGWVSKESLSHSWKMSEYWLYPCIFQETFCLTAMEAAISKTFVISTNLAGLQTTVGDRGIVIDGDPKTIEWQDQCINKLVEIKDGLIDKQSYLERNYQFSKKHSWRTQSELFLKMTNLV